MKKEHSKFGNVGKETGTVDIHRRCNDCNRLAGVDIKITMRKDPRDTLGGYLCEDCYGSAYQLGYKSKFEKSIEGVDGIGSTFINRKDLVWHDNVVHNGVVHSVDNTPDYAEIIEDFIDEEKS